MNSEARTDARVGLTVLLGLIILFFGIAWAKGCNFSTNHRSVVALFPNAGGLEPGDPVMINGVKRGAVHEVKLRPTDVAVTMEFADPVDLRRDAHASVIMFELMGGKKVEITSGTDPATLPDKAIIPGTNGGDIGTVVLMINDFSSTLRSLSAKADTLFTSMNALMGGDELRSNVRVTFASARAALDNIDRTSTDLRAMLAQNREPLHKILTNGEQVFSELSQIAHDNRGGLRELIDSSRLAVVDARAALARAGGLFSGFDTVLQSANRPNSLLWRLTRDPAFATRLDSTIASFLKLSEQIRLQGIDANVRFFNSSDPLK